MPKEQRERSMSESIGAYVYVCWLTLISICYPTYKTPFASKTLWTSSPHFFFFSGLVMTLHIFCNIKPFKNKWLGLAFITYCRFFIIQVSLGFLKLILYCLVWVLYFFFLSSADSSVESQAPEGKGGSSGWPGGSERRGALGQHPRPRAFSQSAVHTLEQRERERDLERVGGC